jgi:hypothetical protein
MHALSRIRTHGHNKQAAAELRLRPHGHRDRLAALISDLTQTLNIEEICSSETLV